MKDGWTALFYASINGFGIIVEYLLERGANINMKDRNH